MKILFTLVLFLGPAKSFAIKCSGLFSNSTEQSSNLITRGFFKEDAKYITDKMPLFGEKFLNGSIKVDSGNLKDGNGRTTSFKAENNIKRNPPQNTEIGDFLYLYRGLS